MGEEAVYFDDFFVKDSYLSEKQELENPEIKEFRETMNNFYHGNIDITKDGEMMLENEGYEYISIHTQEELYDVIHNHFEYPEDINLPARLFTQETQKKIDGTLDKFWHNRRKCVAKIG